MMKKFQRWIVVMATQLCEYTWCHGTVHLKMVKIVFLMCVFYHSFRKKGLFLTGKKQNKTGKVLVRVCSVLVLPRKICLVHQIKKPIPRSKVELNRTHYYVYSLSKCSFSNGSTISFEHQSISCGVKYLNHFIETLHSIFSLHKFFHVLLLLEVGLIWIITMEILLHWY